MNDLELKRKRIETTVKILALLVIGFFVAPFVFISIKGLIGLVIAFGISFGVISFTPYFATVIANWRLKAIKHEARKNPVETLQNRYGEKQAALGNFLESIKKFAAKLKTFESKIEELAAKFPSEVNKFNEQKNQMRQLLNIRKAKYKEAEESLSQFALEIQKQEMLWEASQAALAAGEAAGMDEDAFLNKIKEDSAFNAVQDSLNASFAELEMALMEEEDRQKSLPESVKTGGIDLSKMKTAEKI